MSTEDDPPSPQTDVAPPASTDATASAEPTTVATEAPPADATPGASATTSTPPEAPAEEPLLPATYDEAALQDAVGIQPTKRRSKRVTDEPLDDDGLPDEKRRNRKLMLVAAATVVLGFVIVAFVLFGRINARRYHLTCTTTHAIAEQGRSFPPWGSARLPGAEWRPIALPPNAQCKPQQVDDRTRLEALFLELLLERTSASLSSPSLLEMPGVADGKQTYAPLDLVSMQLEQALLLSRAPERGDQRKQVERMQGDVQYWRASLRLREATAAIAEAARQFDQAALARPLHVSDAGAWAEFLRRLAEQLQAGPGGVPAATAPTLPSAPDRPSAPAGTALPVEPGSEPEAPPPMPDAGVPTGGVLL